MALRHTLIAIILGFQGYLLAVDAGSPLSATQLRLVQQLADHEDLVGGKVPEAPLRRLIVEAWFLEDSLDPLSLISVSKAFVKHLKMGQALLQSHPEAGKTFASLAAKAESSPTLEDYVRMRWSKRAMLLADPLFQGQKIAFCKRQPPNYSHLVMQHFGWRARPGGGLYVLDAPGISMDCRAILPKDFEAGSVLEPSLSYDARRLVFSYVDCRELTSKNPMAPDDPNGKGFFHLYEVNLDGSGLRQLTKDVYDDLMPTYLPDGGIAFSSTRRKGYARCFGFGFGPRWHTYTLHRCDSGGGNVKILSMHDTNEWYPSVDHSGRIMYARWDYIDRDAVTHQNLWSSRPDGTNPSVIWGNGTPKPHCTFQAKAIPGSNRILFIASAHHSITGGSLCLLDPAINSDGLEAITRLTPEIRFPEAEGGIKEYYTTPWPLSENLYLVAYSPTPLIFEPKANDSAAVGLYLLDRQGNREILYRDPQIGCQSPILISPRPTPPMYASLLPGNSEALGQITMSDVYQGLGNVPRGSVKALRIVQILPKLTVTANAPNLGCAGEENPRAVLGTIPVEADGSARFFVPAHKAILFQALDEKGFAVQTMRTLTYLQPGEKISCVGCHESRLSAPPISQIPSSAYKKEALTLQVGPTHGRPYGFVENIQPILNAKCISCHNPEGKNEKARSVDLTGNKKGTWNQSYTTLTKNPKWVPRFPARNQIQITPVGGTNGALGSTLLTMLANGHQKVTITDEEMRRFAEWIDLNAIFSGSTDPADIPAMLAGKPVAMPKIQ